MKVRIEEFLLVKVILARAVCSDDNKIYFWLATHLLLIFMSGFKPTEMTIRNFLLKGL